MTRIEELQAQIRAVAEARVAFEDALGFRNQALGKWQAEMELAWTNFIKRSQAYRYTWIGAYRESGEDIGYCHPCQKPLSLMKWTLNLMPDAKVILDPYMGVGSSIMAGKLLGRKCIGIEIEGKYCEVGARRCSQSVL